MTYPDYVDNLIRRLTDAGYEAYLVGGGLRDSLLGTCPADFDLTTSATPDETLEVFSDMKTIPTGLKHGTVTVLSEGHPVEITTFRIDGDYTDSRHPDSVSFTRSLEEDLARRDFTVNAMAYNKDRGLVDLYGGRADLENKTIRAVGDPHKRMREDALRILRALRFEAQLGFEIEKKTEKALYDCREGLASVSAERRATELMKLITSPHAKKALERLLTLGIGEYLFGDYRPSDTLIGILHRIDSEPADRLGALLFACDIDKARRILRDLKFSNALVRDTLTVISGRDVSLPEADADARRFIARFGASAGTVAYLHAFLGGKDISALLLTVMREGFCSSIAELAINGSDLMALGYSGKQIGKTLEALFEIVLEKPEMNEKESLIKEALRLKGEINA